MAYQPEANDKLHDVLRKIVLQTAISFDVPANSKSDPVGNDTVVDLYRKWLDKLNAAP